MTARFLSVSKRFDASFLSYPGSYFTKWLEMKNRKTYALFSFYKRFLLFFPLDSIQSVHNFYQCWCYTKMGESFFDLAPCLSVSVWTAVHRMKMFILLVKMRLFSWFIFISQPHLVQGHPLIECLCYYTVYIYASYMLTWCELFSSLRIK